MTWKTKIIWIMAIGYIFTVFALMVVHLNLRGFL